MLVLVLVGGFGAAGERGGVDQDFILAVAVFDGVVAVAGVI